jgi:hypothetical protein
MTFQPAAATLARIWRCHKPGKAGLPVGQDTQQCVPTKFLVPMRDFEFVGGCL